MEVTPDATVSILKEMISRHEDNLPIHQIRIIGGGKELQDETTLQEYGLLGSTVHLILHLRC